MRKSFPVDWVAQSIAREKVAPFSHALSGAILDTTSQVSCFSIGKLNEEFEICILEYIRVSIFQSE